ncbi:hypothetical protein BDN67DRAFT_919949 [Paxillus ammoniavirescens]|nr:hypothetical protein BDN67DRAFT_919949 [Paxillus ammoniavirescens]
MRFTAIAFAVVFATIADAHFQLQYPSPRGVFVEDQEPTFCDGYNNAVTNRTVFPLSNGVINLNSEHPTWTVGVVVSTKQDPTSFGDFNSSSGVQLAVPYFQQNGEGKYCFPIDLAQAGFSGIQDGANVTIQVIFDGGDGQLYQCADLTLSANVTVPSNATSCTNVTSTSPAGASPTSTGGARKEMVTMSGLVAVVLGGLALFH